MFQRIYSPVSVLHFQGEEVLENVLKAQVPVTMRWPLVWYFSLCILLLVLVKGAGSWVCRRKNGPLPLDVHVLVPGNCDCYFTRRKGLCRCD